MKRGCEANIAGPIKAHERVGPGHRAFKSSRFDRIEKYRRVNQRNYLRQGGKHLIAGPRGSLIGFLRTHRG